MTSILNKNNGPDIQRGNVKSRGNKIKNNKKDEFPGENYDRLSISIPKRIEKKILPSIRKGNSVYVHKVLS